ncbi:MAG: hypothetical protein RRZ24_01545 [Clostridia bacterium]
MKAMIGTRLVPSTAGERAAYDARRCGAGTNIPRERAGEPYFLSGSEKLT